MNYFKPKNKRERWLNSHFDTKAEVMEALKVSRPTVDNICADEKTFFKYIPELSKATGIAIWDIVRHYKRIDNGV